MGDRGDDDDDDADDDDDDDDDHVTCVKLLRFGCSVL